MYFPYLRGKQFELIAIRELVEHKILSHKVIPVIEPIKLSSTLKKTIDTFEKNDYEMGLIYNPCVGDEIKNQQSILTIFDNSKKVSNSLIFGYIIGHNSKTELLQLMNRKIIINDDILLIHFTPDFVSIYDSIFSQNPPRYNLIPDQRTYARKISKHKVIFADHFRYKDRNADYADDPDEFFSEDHLYYSSEDFEGFSDFSIIGAKYSEKGFRPYAVVIHIVYFDSDKGLRIKHFVSDTNDDSSDTPRKFYEALTKLITWKRNKKIDTYALRILEKYYSDQTYPGLGALKKFSLMHHLELMSIYLEGKI